MSNEIIKYNYDVVTITDRDISVMGYIKPNDSIIMLIEDKVKNDIEQMNNRDELIRSFIINPELGFCMGFNFEGKQVVRTNKHGEITGIYWQTRVFYYNIQKAEIQRLIDTSKSKRK